MIDPRALRTFLAVCRENSISGAARSLNISQPSVSVTIAQLERSVGATLFERSRAGILLTPEGQALKRRAEAMESLLRDAEQEVLLTAQGIGGPLRVGGTPGALVSLLPSAIRRLEATGQRIAMHILERPDRDLAGMLRKGEIEIAFVTTGIEPVADDLEERTYARDPLVLLAGKANAQLPDELSLKDVANLRWVLPEAQGGFRRQIDALFIAADVPVPADAIRNDSLLTTKAIVRGGERVAVLPREVAAAELSIGVLRAIRIREASFERSVGVRLLSGAGRSPMAAALLDALAE